MRTNEIVTASFTYHNIGQGLFYSGRINDFNFIYDCGSENKPQVESVVRDFKRNELQNSAIDLLVLSHLHADHVNGLNALFDTTIGGQITVDTVLLPYFNRLTGLW